MLVSLCLSALTMVAMPQEEEGIVEVRIWQAATYVAPDLLGFFPDDAAAGLALDAWWQGNSKEDWSTEEELALVRRGIRRTTEHRTNILRWVGNQYVWGKDPQHADAIELLYHASDFRESVQHYGMRHYAVYFGLSVVAEKTPNILQALVELCIAVDDPNDLGRVAWGAADQRDALLEHLQPWLEHADPAVRAKAEDVGRIFRKEIDAFAWSQQKAKERAETEFRDSLPIVHQALLEGDSAARRAALDRIQEESLVLIMDDSYLPAFAACATDADASVRRDVVRTVGGHWVWRGIEQHPDAIALMLKMSADENHQVQYDAVYYGLSTVREALPEVTRRLLDMAMFESVMDMQSRIVWGLQHKKEQVSEMLLEDLNSGEEARVIAAYAIYPQMVGEASPVVPKGMPVVEHILGDWILDLRMPQAGRANKLPLSIQLDDRGRAVGTVFEERYEDGSVIATEFGVFFAATVEGKGGEGHLSATLKDGVLTGTLWLPGEHLLLAFEGSRGDTE